MDTRNNGWTISHTQYNRMDILYRKDTVKGGDTMKTWNKMTEDEYNQLKKLFELKVKPSRMRKAGITKRSPYILSLINDSKDFDEYKDKSRELNDKYRKIEKPVKTESEPTGTSELKFYAQMVALLAETNKHMARLVELWEENPRRKIPFFN